MGDLAGWSAGHLAAAACADSADEGVVWACIHELQRRGGPEEFTVAVEALASGRPATRAFGASVVSQLGHQAVVQERPLREPSIATLLATAATESDVEVLEAVAIALCWLQATAGLPWLADLCTHPDADPRQSLATMLPQFGSQQSEAVAVLVGLLDDEETAVRDWASFAFRNQLADAEAPGLREALLRRVDDIEPTTATQAIHALALRRDTRVLPALVDALQRPVDENTGELVDAAVGWPMPTTAVALVASAAAR